MWPVAAWFIDSDSFCRHQAGLCEISLCRPNEELSLMDLGSPHPVVDPLHRAWAAVALPPSPAQILLSRLADAVVAAGLGVGVWLAVSFVLSID